jgi:hypothetical protein
MMCILTREKVYQRRAQIHDSPINRRKGTHVLNNENYVDIEELFWQRDYHNYAHKGCCVDLNILLKMYCYTSVRLQEICKAKYTVRYQALRGNGRDSSGATDRTNTCCC